MDLHVFHKHIYTILYFKIYLVVVIIWFIWNKSSVTDFLMIYYALLLYLVKIIIASTMHNNTFYTHLHLIQHVLFPFSSNQMYIHSLLYSQLEDSIFTLNKLHKIKVICTHSWSWALLEKLPIVQPLKKFSAFYGTWRFITL
jgi:hypothetical protein